MVDPFPDPDVWVAIKELMDIVEMQANTIENLIATVGMLMLIVESLEQGKENDGDHSGPVTPEAPAS